MRLLFFSSKKTGVSTKGFAFVGKYIIMCR